MKTWDMPEVAELSVAFTASGKEHYHDERTEKTVFADGYECPDIFCAKSEVFHS